MSLLSRPDGQPDATLLALWKIAQSSRAQETESLSFWQHYVTKHEFNEQYWICDAEARPGQCQLFTITNHLSPAS